MFWSILEDTIAALIPAFIALIVFFFLNDVLPF